MSANTMWMVKVLKWVEDEIEVSAITEKEAYSAAKQQDNVVRVLSVKWKDYEQTRPD